MLNGGTRILPGRRLYGMKRVYHRIPQKNRSIPKGRVKDIADQEEEKMFEDIERIIVETEEGEEIATIINDDKIDESIIVADGYTVRIKPKGRLKQ